MTEPTQVPEWRAAVVSADSGLSSTCRLVALALSLHWERHDVAAPGAERLSSETGLSERTVRSNLSELAASGWLGVTTKGGGAGVANAYTACLPEPGNSCRGAPISGNLTTPNPATDDNFPATDDGNPAGDSPQVLSTTHFVRTSRTTGTRARPKTPAPDTFPVSEAVTAWAQEKGLSVNLDVEAEKFLNYHRAKGNRHADWDAALRNWLMNAESFAAERKPRARVMQDRSRPTGRVAL